MLQGALLRQRESYEPRSRARSTRPAGRNRVLASITSASLGRRRSFIRSMSLRGLGGSAGGRRRSATAESDRTMRSISLVQSVRATGVEAMQTSPSQWLNTMVAESGCHVVRRYESLPRTSVRNTRFGGISATPRSMHPWDGGCQGPAQKGTGPPLFVGGRCGARTGQRPTPNQDDRCRVPSPTMRCIIDRSNAAVVSRPRPDDLRRRPESPRRHAAWSRRSGLPPTRPCVASASPPLSSLAEPEALR
jgi:hypothetical protein